MSFLKLMVVTPDGEAVNEECLSVVIPGVLGEMQILPGHTPLLSELSAGLVTYEAKSHAAVSLKIEKGVVKIEDDHVSVMCEGASIA